MSTRMCYIKIPEGKYCEDLTIGKCPFCSNGYCTNVRIEIVLERATDNRNYHKSDACKKVEQLSTTDQLINVLQFETEKKVKEISQFTKDLKVLKLSIKNLSDYLDNQL